MQKAKFRIFLSVITFLIGWGACNPVFVLAQADAFNRLVEDARAEMAKQGGKIVIGTDWTNEEAKPLLSALKKDLPFVETPSFRRLRTTEEMQRMLMETKAGKTPPFDILNISHEAWPD